MLPDLVGRATRVARVAPCCTGVSPMMRDDRAIRGAAALMWSRRRLRQERAASRSAPLAHVDVDVHVHVLMAGLDPAIQATFEPAQTWFWIAGSNPAMTRGGDVGRRRRPHRRALRAP